MHDSLLINCPLKSLLQCGAIKEGTVYALAVPRVIPLLGFADESVWRPSLSKASVDCNKLVAGRLKFLNCRGNKLRVSCRG